MCWWRLGMMMIAAALVVTKARGEVSPEFELSRTDSVLTIQVDLRTLISDETIRRVRQGVDLLFQIEFRVETPRRFWGSSTASERHGYLRLGYRLVTDDYRMTVALGDNHSFRTLATDSSLQNFLRDSVTAPLARLDSLNVDKPYYLELKATSILLTGINIAAGRESDTTDDSPLEFLFRQFLRMTGYGRHEERFTSGAFSIPDVPTKP